MMKNQRLSEAISGISDRHIEEAADFEAIRPRRIKWIVAAACAAVVLTAIPLIALITGVGGGDSGKPFAPGVVEPSQAISFGELEREYNKALSGNELAIEIYFPWDMLTTPEQYNRATWEGRTYRASQELPADAILSPLGDVLATGVNYDMANIPCVKLFEAYEIKGISPAYKIALKMDGQYFIYKNDDYRFPATLGELLEEIRLDELFELERYSLHPDGREQGYYAISNDAPIWETLKSCADAPCTITDAASFSCTYISFTMTSQSFGIYKLAMYITEDGRLWTNIFSYGMICDIGKEAAAAIMDYVESNAVEVEFEPYLYSIGGTVTEICEDYLLVDDTVLCTDPEDGMTFKVWMDAKMSYAIRKGYGIAVGDLVSVSFANDGLKKTDDQYEIPDPYSIHEGFLSNGDIGIPE